jgi:hypothetical protein
MRPLTTSSLVFKLKGMEVGRGKYQSYRRTTDLPSFNVEHGPTPSCQVEGVHSDRACPLFKHRDVDFDPFFR